MGLAFRCASMLRLTRIRITPLRDEEAARAVALPLTFDERSHAGRGRLATTLADGTAVALLLAAHRRGAALEHGAVLEGDDGELAIVVAALQPLTRVSAATPVALLRALYHLANRHVAAQIASDHVLIERDPVLERMLLALGARIEHAELAFEPEPGAYDRGAHHHAESAGDEAAATIGEQLSIAAHRARDRAA